MSSTIAECLKTISYPKFTPTLTEKDWFKTGALSCVAKAQKAHPIGEKRNWNIPNLLRSNWRKKSTVNKLERMKVLRLLLFATHNISIAQQYLLFLQNMLRTVIIKFSNSLSLFNFFLLLYKRERKGNQTRAGKQQWMLSNEETKQRSRVQSAFFSYNRVQSAFY